MNRLILVPFKLKTDKDIIKRLTNLTISVDKDGRIIRLEMELDVFCVFFFEEMCLYTYKGLSTQDSFD